MPPRRFHSGRTEAAEIDRAGCLQTEAEPPSGCWGLSFRLGGDSAMRKVTAWTPNAPNRP